MLLLTPPTSRHSHPAELINSDPQFMFSGRVCFPAEGKRIMTFIADQMAGELPSKDQTAMLKVLNTSLRVVINDASYTDQGIRVLMQNIVNAQPW